MALNITFFLGVAQSNLTRLQAGHFDWRHSEDRRFGKTCWQGWQPSRLRFGRETDKLKTETNHELKSR
jgi:hypothetical protein